jgi:hypothetical protein
VFSGQHGDALHYYEQALLDNPDEAEDLTEHNASCQAGIAKMCLKTGDIQRQIYKIIFDI